jgi:hypothetical protein
MPIPTSARLRARRRLPAVLAALATFALTGCGDCCLFHHKKNNNNELVLAAAARQNGAAGGVPGGGTGSTGGGPPGGGPGGPPGGNEIPEIHVGAAAGVLTLVVGASLILFDRRRRTSGPVACA